MKEIHIDHLSGDSASPLPITVRQSAASQDTAGAGGGKQPLQLPSHEVLAHLAQEDPQAFELLRCELVESFIASAPSRLEPRLRGIQFRVDHVRRLSRSALGSTVEVYQLMWASFLSLNGVWQEVVHLKERCVEACPSSSTPSPLPVKSARILEFKPRPRDRN